MLDQIKTLIFSLIPESCASTKRLLPVVCREFSRICTENAGLLWRSVWLDFSRIQEVDGLPEYVYLSSEDMGPVYAWAARHLSAMRDLTVRTDESMIIAYVKSEVPLPAAPAGSFVMCDCNDCAGRNEDHACFNRNQWQHKHRV